MTKTDSIQNSDISKTLGIASPHKKNRRIKYLTGFSALIIVIIIAVYMLQSRNTSGTRLYKTEEVKIGDLTITVTATGNIEPTNQVDVGIEVSGTIKTVEADYNDEVKTGQVLARLDTSKLEAQVLQAKAALESARTKVVKAKAEVMQTGNELARLNNVKKLSKGKVPSQSEMDSALASMQIAQAEEAGAKTAISEAVATLKLRETDLSKAVILSPVNGIVLVRSVEPGQTVAASMQTPVLFTLAEDLKQMELHVDVDEADVGKVRAKQNASFVVDAYPDIKFPAQVTEVRFAPKTVEGVVTYETVLAVDNSGLSLRPGMTATADIIVKEIKDILLIPNIAFRFTPPVQQQKISKKSGGLLGMLLPIRRPKLQKKEEEFSADRKKKCVWVLHDNIPSSIYVVTGDSDGRMTEVKANNIKPGDKIIIGMESWDK